MKKVYQCTIRENNGQREKMLWYRDTAWNTVLRAQQEVEDMGRGSDAKWHIADIHQI